MIFKMLIDNEGSQLVALNALYDTWKNHQQVCNSLNSRLIISFIKFRIILFIITLKILILELF